MITYLRGDATNPQGPGTKIIAHICNDMGGWGKGFVLALSRRWREPEQEYRAWHRYNGELRLGDVQLVQVTDSIWVCNMIAQHGYKSSAHGVPPIRYDALEVCLRKLASEANKMSASVHMPMIGTGLAGGSWTLIEPIIASTLASVVPVIIYQIP